MKILNTTEINDEAGIRTSILGTPVSGLIPTFQLPEKSLIHIAISTDGENYESRKMTIRGFQEKIYEAVQNQFKTEFHTSDADWHNAIKEYFDGRPENERQEYEFLDGVDESTRFVKHICLDFQTLKSYVDNKDSSLLKRVNDIDGTLSYLDCMFDPEMNLVTTDSDGKTTNESVNNDGTDNYRYCQLAIKDGNKISNTWNVPASGNLVVYGWLDSSAALNNKSIQSSFCVLEAYINGEWEIIGVQTVIPAKSITYVGFNVQVHEGLKIRTRTGFTVGAKSGQYSKEQDGNDTLSNSTPNGFKCQIFSRKEN